MNLKVLLEPSEEGGYTALVPVLRSTLAHILKQAKVGLEDFLSHV